MKYLRLVHNIILLFLSFQSIIVMIYKCRFTLEKRFSSNNTSVIIVLKSQILCAVLQNECLSSTGKDIHCYSCEVVMKL